MSKFTTEEKRLFVDEIWEKRFSGHEEEPWFMSYDKFAYWCSFVNLKTGTLKLPKGTRFVEYGPFNRTLIKRICLPNTLETIGSRAFYGCDGLKKIIIPEGVVGIGDEAFYGCDSLESIIIPSGVKYIGASAFSHCGNLKSVIIKEGIQVIEKYAFSYCPKLKECIIPETVQKLGSRIFDGDYSAEKIVLPLQFSRNDDALVGHAERAKVFYY